MKICWYNDYKLGAVVDGKVHDVSGALRVLPAAAYPRGVKGDLLITHLDAVRTEINKLLPSAPSIPVAQARFLSPVVNPTKIIGVPVNYLKHVEEAQANIALFTDRYRGSIEEQGLFLKANSALIGAGEEVLARFPERETHHELELGVVIGKQVSRIAPQQAFDCIAGYSIALDMVIRGPEDRSLRKSIDTYAVLGPWLVTADEIADPEKLDIVLTVNGQPRQQSNTAHMIMKLAQQISWASQYYTLYPGDIIMTGTCEGVAPVVPGDVMHCVIESIGAMDVKVGKA